MNRSFRSRVGRLAVGLGCVALLWACNAPFIPVPPPGTVFTAELVSDGAGAQKTVWSTAGLADEKAASAKFFIFDDDRGTGVIVRAGADGTYVAPPFDGVRGDHVYIHYETPEGDSSEIACRQLIEGPAPAPNCTQ
jgi:hypothetical protein